MIEPLLLLPPPMLYLPEELDPIPEPDEPARELLALPLALLGPGLLGRLLLLLLIPAALILARSSLANCKLLFFLRCLAVPLIQH